MNIKNIKKKNLREPYDHEYEMSKFRSRAREKEVERGYPNRDMTKAQKTSLVLDHIEGASVKQLSDRYGISRKIVTEVIREYTGEVIGDE